MMNERERAAIGELWKRKLKQDAMGLPQAERHRNLEPESADAIHVLACGLRARNILEIGGSSGISTIALASAARQTHGRLISIEMEPQRQRESQERVKELELAAFVEFVCADAGTVLPSLSPMDFVLIDCEKDDYIRFFDMLNLQSSTVVVADNIISHRLTEYVSHVRGRGLESITLTIGKGLELSRRGEGSPQVRTGTE